jgi:hypothetical protein
LSILIASAVVVGVAVWYLSLGRGSPRPLPIPGEGDKIEVEVLNATQVDGLARAMTLEFRRAGIDVVFYGTAREAPLDSTLILMRRGDTTRGMRIRDVLGTGKIVVQPDASLLLDASVLLGLDLVSFRGIRP